MGTERAGVEHQAVADAQGGYRQHLALLGEVRGEEDAQRQLGQLDGLAVDGPDADPQARAVVVLAQVGDERRQHEHDRRQQQQIAVAVEVTGTAHHHEGQDVGAHPHRRPTRLGLAPVAARSGPASRSRARSAGWRWAGARRWRRGRRSGWRCGRRAPGPSTMARNGPQVGGDLRRGADRGEHVGGHDDEGAEDEQPQLGAPFGPGTADPHPIGGSEATQESGHLVSLLPEHPTDPGTQVHPTSGRRQYAWHVDAGLRTGAWRQRGRPPAPSVGEAAVILAPVGAQDPVDGSWPGAVLQPGAVMARVRGSAARPRR